MMQQQGDVDVPTFELSDATTAALRSALVEIPVGRAHEARRALGPAARLVCEDARRAGLRAEQLIVGLKQRWAALEQVQQMPHHHCRDLLRELVSLCINEFYGDGVRSSR